MSRARPESERNIQPCMPPLLPEERNPAGKKLALFSGGSCEHIIISHFLRLGINCAEPIIDDGADLLIEREPGIWKRGQVKKVVHTYDLDRGMFKRYGTEVRRDVYDFFFQSNNLGTRSRKDTDYFYHVLMTPLREIIWETPSDLVPYKEDRDSFISNKTVVLDRSSWVRRKVEINFREQIISAKYDPKVMETHPLFFNKNTVNNYME
jgi:hypothetical protein